MISNDRYLFILNGRRFTELFFKFQRVDASFHWNLQMESQFSTKLSQSGAQNSIHQQRIDEMDATVQKALLRSKRLEDERHNFHSRLIETHKESSLLKVGFIWNYRAHFKMYGAL